MGTSILDVVGPFVDNGELENDFINEELFVEEGESMLGLPKICGYVGSGAWGINAYCCY
jgi:hypothetical protein